MSDDDREHLERAVEKLAQEFYQFNMRLVEVRVTGAIRPSEVVETSCGLVTLLYDYPTP